MSELPFKKSSNRSVSAIAAASVSIVSLYCAFLLGERIRHAKYNGNMNPNDVTRVSPVPTYLSE